MSNSMPHTEGFNASPELVKAIAFGGEFNVFVFEAETPNDVSIWEKVVSYQGSGADSFQDAVNVTGLVIEAPSMSNNHPRTVNEAIRLATESPLSQSATPISATGPPQNPFTPDRTDRPGPQCSACRRSGGLHRKPHVQA